MGLKTMHGSKINDSNRDKDDFYATDPKTLKLFLQALKNNNQEDLIQDPIWECACGTGNLSKELLSLGYNVYSTDLIYRDSICEDTVDFLKSDKKWKGTILTNPPYKYAEEFTIKALDSLVDGTIIFLLKSYFLESKSRYDNIFRKFPPHSIWLHVTRQQTFSATKKPDKGSSAFFYVWVVWKKNYFDIPKIYWIPENKDA